VGVNRKPMCLYTKLRSWKCWWRNMVFFWVDILLPPNVTWHKCGIPKRGMVQGLHPLDLVVCIHVKMAQRNLEECFCLNIWSSWDRNKWSLMVMGNSTSLYTKPQSWKCW
jgi:hypothetical protein